MKKFLFLFPITISLIAQGPMKELSTQGREEGNLILAGGRYIYSDITNMFINPVLARP